MNETAKTDQNFIDALMKERDEFAMGFGEWLPENYYQWYNPHEWISRLTGEKSSTQELLTIYKSTLK